jgi:CMP-N,N'-diacetyllegionaminic acid synthase
MNYPYVSGLVWALLPARGGSKGIPRKNLLQLGGRPLLSYSIEHARQCAAIARTIVSTDDAEIAECARRHGAEVPFERPAIHASDTATDLDVFRHALLWFAQHEGRIPELLVHLRPTNPIREAGVINTAVRQMLDCPEADALRTVAPVLDTPYKMWRIENNQLIPLLTIVGQKEAHSMPRQKLPPVYLQNGYVDVIRARTILELDSMCGRTVLPLITEQGVVDLDVPEQIPAAEAAVLSHYRTLETQP